MNRILCTIVMLWACVAPAALKYVDSQATGANNGNNWTDAWVSLDVLRRQSNGFIFPGDTVYIASRSFTNTGDIELKPGTASGGWIRYYFGAGPTPGLTTLYTRLKTYGYTEINGGLDQNYHTNLNSAYDVPLITNNIGLWINRQTNWYGSASKGRSIFCVTDPMIVKWVRCTGSTNRLGPEPPKSDSSHEVYTDRLNLGVEVAYCWIDKSSGHGAATTIGFGASTATNFSLGKVHHNLIENNESDVFGMKQGIDVYSNMVRRRENQYTLGGCNDSFLFSSDTRWIRVFNNLIEPNQNVLAYFVGQKTNIHDFYFFNNILTPTEPSNAGISGRQGHFQIEQDRIEAGNTYYVRSNVVIAHNTWNMNSTLGQDKAVNFITKDGALLNGDFLFSPQSFWWANNIIAQTDTSALTFKPWAATFYPYNENNTYGTNDMGRGYIYGTNDLVIDGNWFGPYWSNNLNAITWGPKGTSKLWLTNATAIAAALGYSNNVTSVGACLVDAVGRNWRPASSNMNIGIDLSQFTNRAPALGYDFFGTPRTGRTAGAIEFGSGSVPVTPPPAGDTNGLLCWLRFEDDFVSQGYAADSSTNNARMLRYGWSNPATNWPTAAAGRVGAQAANFTPYYNSRPYNDTNFFDGQYGAITNLGSLGTLTQATFTVWWKPANVGTVSTDRTKNHNGTFLDAGYDPAGWHFGRYYSTTFGEPKFMVTTNSGGIVYSWQNAFPQVVEHFWYTNAVWWHLAATIDCSVPTNLVCVLYTNGVMYSSNTLALTSSNAVHYLAPKDPAGSAHGPWIAVGAWTHNGTPPLSDSDQLPNNGWLAGAMDDVRIYGRVLSSAEIATIAGAPAEGAGGVAPTTIALLSNQTVTNGVASWQAARSDGTYPMLLELRQDGVLKFSTNYPGPEDWVYWNFTPAVADEGVYQWRASNAWGQVQSQLFSVDVVVPQSPSAPGAKVRVKRDAVIISQ